MTFGYFGGRFAADFKQKPFGSHGRLKKLTFSLQTSELSKIKWPFESGRRAKVAQVPLEVKKINVLAADQ